MPNYLIIAIFSAVVLYFSFKYFLFRLRSKNNALKSLDLVMLKICVPKKESQQDKEVDKEAFGATGGDFKEYCSIGSQLFESLCNIADFGKISPILNGQPYMSFEVAVVDSMINIYTCVPSSMVKLVEKKITALYPDVFLEAVDGYNLFEDGFSQFGTYVHLAKESIYPIKTFNHLSNDPFSDILNSMSKFGKDERAALQIMIKPELSGWSSAGRQKAQDLLNQNDAGGSSFNPLVWIGRFLELIFKGAENLLSGDDSPPNTDRMTQVKEEQISAFDTKNTQFGFDTVIRVVSTAKDPADAGSNLGSILSCFANYTYADFNSFDVPDDYKISQDYLFKNFILRNFKKPFIYKFKKSILSSDELASIFHIPSVRFSRVPNFAWQNYKVAPPPDNLPSDGILLGHSTYRGETKEVYIKPEDRFRHFYVIGQTGTGKSSILQAMIRQDFRIGNGVCVIDPHGQLVEDLLPFIPKERADDVIIFNPADTDRPMGFNLLEAHDEAERDMVALDAMNIMIKIFDEEIFGPRLQDYFRNGCLTLMEYPDGGAMTDIVRLFTDEVFQAERVKHVTNPIVRTFWDSQMKNTSKEEKMRIIPYFAAKFGAFITNTMMRNILGQTQSAFDFSEVMQDQKILLMNLSKGLTGDINSKLLGLIIVSKLQMAAMRRQKMAKEDRTDFFLYIDEFQNYITDSIESILSEARKYRLGLNLAHQYVSQLVEKNDEKIKNAVFGNVGSMMCYKIGAQDAEFMAKEMAPVFSDQDLINVDKFKGVLKLSIDTQPSKPFSFTPLNPYLEKGSPDLKQAFVELSRLKYGRDKEFVNREILRRIG